MASRKRKSDTSAEVIKCRAAVMWKPKKPLSIEEIEVAPPKAHEVRIKILFTCVCRTDLFTLDGKEPDHVVPCILGHEGAGIVESVGEGVTYVKPGDHVIPVAIPQCNECELCQHPDTNLCSKFKETRETGLMGDGTSRFTCKGKTVYHYMGCSTFTEYTVVPDIAVAKVTERAPLDKIFLLGCGVSAGYGAPLNVAKVKAGSTVGVWGLGTVGLAAIMGAKAAGARRIIGIDINSKKFEHAGKFGATEVLNPRELRLPKSKSFVDYLAEKYNGGFDYTFECTGNTTAMEQAFESLHDGWGVSCVTGTAAGKVSVHPGYLVYGGTWKGAAFGGWKCRDDVPKLVEKYLKGEIMLDDFITHRFDLAEINEAVKIFHSGDGLRSMIAVGKQ